VLAAVVTAAGAGAAGAATEESVRRCAARMDLTLKAEGEEGPDGRGRLGVKVPGGRYAGFVEFPSGHVVDVYVARSERAARRAARGYERFLRAFGLGDEARRYVRRAGTIVLGRDDGDLFATERELARLARCG